MQRVAAMTNRYPYLGPLLWALSVQYFLTQLAVAAAWTEPAYSWTRNVISDLGNTACGPYADRVVCSPLHAEMNASFIMLGLTMALGSLLIYQQFTRTRSSLIGFSMMAAAGVGAVLVGVFPENTISLLHGLGAFLAIGVGNVALIVLGLGLRGVRPGFRAYTYATGVIATAAFVLFALGIYLGLGQGGMERLAGYPQTLWLIALGCYMSGVRYRAHRKAHRYDQHRGNS